MQDEAQDWIDNEAAALGDCPFPEAAERIISLERQARESGHPQLSVVRRLVQALAELREQPDDLMDALIDAGASGYLIEAFINRYVQRRGPSCEDKLGKLIVDGRAAPTAIQVALVHPVNEKLKRFAIEQASRYPSRLVYNRVESGAVDQPTLRLLFDAPDPEIAQAAAMAAAAGAQDDKQMAVLPPEMRARWREIVVGCPSVWSGSSDWRGYLGEILEGDPALCADWVRYWLKRWDAGGENYESSRTVLEAIRGLLAAVRTALIANVPAETEANRLLGDVILCLVTGNAEAAAALLDRPECSGLHHLALAGNISAEWMERALLAMERGWNPESIVQAQHGGVWALVGTPIQHYQRRIDELEALRPGPSQRKADRRLQIVEVGIAFYQARRDWK